MSIFTNRDDIRKLNSMTKYPSILTYHNLGPRGSLVDSLVEGRKFSCQMVYVTEKIDGTNSRILVFTDEEGNISDYFFGSREEMLYAKGDRVCIDNSGITIACSANMEIIQKASENKTIQMRNDGDKEPILLPNRMYVLYGETYGGKINAHKQYTGHNAINMRFFDAWCMTIDEVLNYINTMTLDALASWRDNGGQPFMSVTRLYSLLENLNLTKVPYINCICGCEIPDDLQGVWDWMQQFAHSVATIDSDGKGDSEGIVIRTENRDLIRKIRFEDYKKTKKMGLIY